MEHSRESLPIILHSHSLHQHVGQCDCDCACALEPPVALAGPVGFASFDCDCACALDLSPNLAQPTAAVAWLAQEAAFSLPLQGRWRAYLNPAGPVGLVVLNASAQEVLAAFDSPATLREASERFPGLSPAAFGGAVDGLAQIGLLRPVGMAAPGPARTITLSAWLHVTEACNLACPYCYVQKRPSAMRAEAGRQAVDRLVALAHHHGFRTLKLKYAGGEPTLNFAVVRQIHQHAARRTTEMGLALDEVLLTNGVGVSDAVLDYVVGVGMRLMVSLDGGPDTHDRVRARRDGKSTYAAVINTVERAVERGLKPDISITLTALNLDGVVDAVAFALERELPFNLNFYRECSPLASRGQWHDGAKSTSLTPDPTRLVSTMQEILALMRLYPAYPLPLSGILDRTRLDVPHSYTCSAGRDYVAVTADGAVSACQMMLDEPWAELGDEDFLTQIRRQGEAVFKPVEQYPECRACSWRMACSGGCPLLRDTTQHREYCQVYRLLLPQLVQVEANRLIAQSCSIV